MTEQAAGVVVVTGAGSGMGRDIALDQAVKGPHVVLVGRRRESLEHTASAQVLVHAALRGSRAA